MLNFQMTPGSRARVIRNSTRAFKSKAEKGSRLAAEQIKGLFTNYVPLDTGKLRQTAIINTGSAISFTGLTIRSTIQYVQNYAARVYFGVSESGKALNYKEPGTGPFWDKKIPTDVKIKAIAAAFESVGVMGFFK